jgi:hypothetical protein
MHSRRLNSYLEMHDRISIRYFWCLESIYFLRFIPKRHQSFRLFLVFPTLSFPYFDFCLFSLPYSFTGAIFLQRPILKAPFLRFNHKVVIS